MAAIPQPYVPDLAQCDPDDSQRIKREMRETSSKFDVFFPSGPVPVDTKMLVLLEHYLKHFFQIVEERERGVREHQDLPPLNPR